MARPQGLTPDGEEITRFRLELGLTTAQVSAQVGVDPQSVRRYERNGSAISREVASRLARVLGVTVTDITRPAANTEAA